MGAFGSVQGGQPDKIVGQSGASRRPTLLLLLNSGLGGALGLGLLRHGDGGEVSESGEGSIDG